MRLKSLKLDDFRGFDHLELDLDRPLTLLFGENGKGKSTVIQALAIAMSALPRSEGGPELQSGDIRFTSTYVAQLLQRTPANAASVELTLELGGQAMRLGQKLERTGKVEWTGDHEKLIKTLDAGVDVLDQVLPVVAFFTADRNWRDVKTPEQVPVGRLAGYAGARNAGLDLGELRAWWRRSDGIRDDGIEVPALVEAERALTSFLGSSALPARWDDQIEDIIVHVPRLNAHVALRELSDGYRNLIALVVDLARRAAQLNPQFGEDLLDSTTGIVAIDELDLHLHPKWQREVLPRLRAAFPGFQWVITTHSPLVLASVDSNSELVELGPNTDDHVFVRGRDPNSVLDVMGVDERDPRFTAELGALHEAIDSGSVADARTRLEKLRKDWGPDDPALIRAEALLAFEESNEEP